MASDHVKAPALDDMMKCHVYIGYCQKDSERVKTLHELLKRHQLTCCLRSSLDVEESSQSDNIKQGITFSHKCLLYISPDYLNDPFSDQELDEAKRKSKFLGNTSVFGIIQSNVNQQQLGGYKQFELIYLSDNQPLQDSLTNSLMKNSNFSGFELKPELQSMPKQNVGVVIAYSYFLGFLQIVIPVARRLLEQEMQHQSIDKEFLVKKMLLIVPRSVRSPPTFKEPGVLEQSRLAVKICADRAGREKREYTLPIYKLTVDNDKKDFYYFVGDFSACLYSIREAFDRNLTSMSKDEVYEARNEFILTLKALLTHPDHQSLYGNQWELLLWPDEDDDENRQVILSDFLRQQIKNRRLTESPQIRVSPPQIPEGITYKIAIGIRSYLMYGELDHYELDDSNRGFCVIISNSFPNDPDINRPHAETEIGQLKHLFETLRFTVHVERNLNKEQMLNCLEKYQSEDHPEKGAFVCCLLTHGDKGLISATDEDVPVIKLMEFFYENKCPGLKGKPKLFFIGACLGAGGKEKPMNQERQSESIVSPASVEPLSNEANPDIEDDSSESSSSENGDEPTPSTAEIVRDLIPSEVDFIISYAALPDNPAWADKEKGGLYVQALCKHLARDLEIDVTLRNVSQEVRKHLDEYAKEKGEKYPSQYPFHIIMPPQKFLFLGS